MYVIQTLPIENNVGSTQLYEFVHVNNIGLVTTVF